MPRQIESYGYDGLMSESAAALWFDHAGGLPGVVGTSDWLVTEVAGSQVPTVQIAPGTGYGHGIVDIVNTPVQLSNADGSGYLAVPQSGTTWWLITAQRDWTLTVPQGQDASQPPPAGQSAWGGNTRFRAINCGTTKALPKGAMETTPGTKHDTPGAWVTTSAGSTRATVRQILWRRNSSVTVSDTASLTDTELSLNPGQVAITQRGLEYVEPSTGLIRGLGNLRPCSSAAELASLPKADDTMALCLWDGALARWDTATGRWLFLDTRIQSYAPTWGADPLHPPSLGNGSLVGRYARMWDRVWVYVCLTFAADGSTNGGWDQWGISVPFAHASTTPKTHLDLEAWVPNAGGVFAGKGYIAAGSSMIQPLVPKSASTSVLDVARSCVYGGAAGTGVPATTSGGGYPWSTGGDISMTGIYPAVFS